MNLKKIIEQIVLNELNKILSEQDAPKDAVFGQYLFGPYRKDAPGEPNTKKEDEFLDALSMYVVGNSKRELSKIIKDLIATKNQGYYKEFLEPPNTEVYRYMTVPLWRAKKILNLPEREITEHPNRAWWVDNPGTLKPLSDKTMSWTTDPNNIAFDMILEPEPGFVSMLLIANTSENEFLINPNSFAGKFYNKDVMGTILDMFKNEMETISYGPVDIIGASFLYVDMEDIRDRVLSKIDEVKLPKKIMATINNVLQTIDEPNDKSNKEIIIKKLKENVIYNKQESSVLQKHLKKLFGSHIRIPHYMFFDLYVALINDYLKDIGVGSMFRTKSAKKVLSDYFGNKNENLLKTRLETPKKIRQALLDAAKK